MTRPLPGPIAMLLVALVIVRVATVTWSATSRTKGDFYASMPGAHVETLNPDLWNSPDLADAWGYQQHTYFHGPVQYLSLYPLALLDSFAQIAAMLLPIYALLLVATFWMLWRVAQALGANRHLFVPLLAATFLFFPLLQAYLQREFEVVLTFALTGALLLLVRDRRSGAAAALAYAAWFKYIPLLFAGYLVLRRWWRPLMVFAAVSVVIVVAAHLLFGLSRFFNNNVPGHAAQLLALWGYEFRFDATGQRYGLGFCEGWGANNTTFISIRYGLCTMAASHPWVHPPLIYLVICATVAVVYLRAHFRLESTTRSSLETRRRAVECSIVATICACFFFAHYYYLIVLIIPFTVLLTIYMTDRRHRAMALWAVSYALISAFVVPLALMSRVVGFDVWGPYIWNGWCWAGELLLVTLLLNEYRRLSLEVTARG